MEIITVLNKETCETNIKSRKKRPAVEELAQVMTRHPDLKDFPADKIANSLMEREELGSTGFGGGLAIPHCKIEGLNRFFLGLAISRKGVNFDAIDNRKVHLFCVIIGPEDKPEDHVKLLAEVSLVLREESVRNELIKAPTPTALYEDFLRHSSGSEPEEEEAPRRLLVAVIQDEEVFIEIMELFVKLGIPGVSVFESNSMSRMLSNVPLFADFINFLGKRSEFHRTLIALIPENEGKLIFDSIENITGDLKKHTGVTLILLDTLMLSGSLESI